MKILIYTLLVLAVGLIGYNLTFVDFNDLFGEESKIALIGILSSGVVFVLMIILLMSRSIAKKAGK